MGKGIMAAFQEFLEVFNYIDCKFFVVEKLTFGEKTHTGKE